MWRIGLTGGIGSGKSTVGDSLRRHGAHLIDTDQIARDLTRSGGEAMPALQAAFGPGMLDPSGALDRIKMRELVFTDAQAKQTLERILHPMIRSISERQIAATTATISVLDVPLLVESGHWLERVDEVWVVDCSVATQIQRVMTRSGWTHQAVQAVIARQASRDQRLACADMVLFNDGSSLSELGQAVDRSWARLSDRIAAACDSPRPP